VLSALNTDVCVVGGGPSGATAARRLAQLGYRVCLVERSTTPTGPVCESLPIKTLQLLKELGLDHHIELAGLDRCEVRHVRWSGATRREVGATLLVNRGRFDRMMLDATADAGVIVLRPANARRPRRAARRWDIPINGTADVARVQSRFLIDATGRRSNTKRAGVHTVALLGYWQGARRGGFPEMFVEAGERVWFWGATTPDGNMATIAFVDPTICSGCNDQERRSLYHALITQSRLFGQRSREMILGEMRVRDATSRVDHEPWTPDALRIGDRAFAMDPLSSQGVQAAIRSGLQASVIAHTMLSGGDVTAAMEFHRHTQHAAVAAHARLTSQIYAAQSFYASSFWQARVASEPEQEAKLSSLGPLSDDEELVLSPRARLALHPVIEGNRICRRRVLTHPELQRPIGWLGGVALGPALSAIAQGRAASQILADWSREVSPERARAVLIWLIERKILLKSRS
jgi:flavin-dependent dehydrogenase